MRSSKSFFILKSSILFLLIIELLSFNKRAIPSRKIIAQSIATFTPMTTSSPTLATVTPPAMNITQALPSDENIAFLENRKNESYKDNWDKLNSASGLLELVGTIITSGILVWIISRATQAFNQRQLDSEERRAKRELEFEAKRAERESKIAEIQTVQSFIPQLASTDPRVVETSLLAIAGMGNEDLAARLAELYRTDGAFKALNRMVASGNTEIADAAERSLNIIFNTEKQSIVGITCNRQITGTGFIYKTDGHIITTQVSISKISDISIVTPQETLPAKLVGQDTQANLALLKIDRGNFPIMSIHQESKIDILSEVFLIGYEQSVGLVVKSGKIVGINRLTEYPISELINVEVTIPLSFGGAVVINQVGKLIGIVVLLKLSEQGKAISAFVLPVTSLSNIVKNMVNQQNL